MSLIGFWALHKMKDKSINTNVDLSFTMFILIRQKVLRIAERGEI